MPVRRRTNQRGISDKMSTELLTKPRLSLKNPRLVWAIQLVLALAAAVLGWLQMENAAGTAADVLLALAPQYVLLGILTVFAIPLVIYALCGRWQIATGVGGGITTLYALVNYYVKMLHGNALLAADIANVATAADVAGAYTIRPDATSVKLALFYLPVLALAVIQWLVERPLRREGRPAVTWHSRLKRWGIGAAFLFVLFFFGYFGPLTIMPNNAGTLAYAIAFNFNSFGYTPSVVSSVLLLLDPVAEPEGYTAEAAAAAAATADYTPAVDQADPEDYPDIVLILNETLYDPALVTDLQADAPYMDYLHSLAGEATTGYALVPDVGGGTNRSEFTLLSSHSMTLMPGATPFATMSMEGQPSVVSYLESLGYATLAAHPAGDDNYRRGMAWPALGFDETYFDDTFRPGYVPYGGRIMYITDATAYPTFTQLYESMPEDQPRFAYLLTIQNHGGYEDVDESQLLVHADTYYGEHDHEVDEFLSCLSLDDEALQYLTQYFTDLYKETGRRVVLLMVGDHAPYMVDAMTDSSLTGTDRTVRQRATPFLLWTNYPAETRVPVGTDPDALPVIDMSALLPLAAEQAGLPLSPYYQYILALRQHCTAWTNLSGGLLTDGSYAADGTDKEVDRWLSGYYMLEYSILTGDEGGETFSLPAAQ